ncbi:2-amino-4-hydroxy-6-hydroxymethyldihydropteridine diphosphokinase [Gordonia sp. HY002]|uniref:2-amino-4-hydroxy-6- hydroxymethyldihydropteridine diphosphokinase n=1 Tax=Gordonia zhenghanii TaxID=2911516 RepID=UPI001EF06F49|nr:2-amino-4-hydroxy-6-hydroxymethyldihydropteridine diphosphokinase [Gordonia zhenghanii]MCF8571118.1 2-amino-4-hydroxy-6-hydroxymethyldihydropteridine diphosphokinase [Gordonia zhenghanii]MCF8604674.1 2-amino-4-hydroxy-6-hydroxymethyldihydropteridine diphosphokinase [Gordonia zhenghanii]
MSRAVLSAGSNIGDSVGLLRSVVVASGDDLIATSDVYRTPPWGGVEQDDFVNITLIVAGDRTPHEWLEFCRACEQDAGRVRDVRWGPRTLDVDVVSVDVDGEPVISDDPELTLPHPRAGQRAFVLVPWLQIDPDAELVVEGRGRRVVDLVASLDDAEVAGIRRAEALQ